jgi:hypothetical protein
MASKRGLFLVFILLAGQLFVGCGGGQSNSSPTFSTQQTMPPDPAPAQPNLVVGLETVNSNGQLYSSIDGFSVDAKGTIQRVRGFPLAQPGGTSFAVDASAKLLFVSQSPTYNHTDVPNQLLIYSLSPTGLKLLQTIPLSFPDHPTFGSGQVLTGLTIWPSAHELIVAYAQGPYYAGFLAVYRYDSQGQLVHIPAPNQTQQVQMYGSFFDFPSRNIILNDRSYIDHTGCGGGTAFDTWTVAADGTLTPLNSVLALLPDPDVLMCAGAFGLAFSSSGEFGVTGYTGYATGGGANTVYDLHSFRLLDDGTVQQVSLVSTDNQPVRFAPVIDDKDGLVFVTTSIDLGNVPATLRWFAFDPNTGEIGAQLGIVANPATHPVGTVGGFVLAGNSSVFGTYSASSSGLASVSEIAVPGEVVRLATLP